MHEGRCKCGREFSEIVPPRDGVFYVSSQCNPCIGIERESKYRIAKGQKPPRPEQIIAPHDLDNIRRAVWNAIAKNLPYKLTIEVA